jgi:hypothetical protein
VSLAAVSALAALAGLALAALALSGCGLAVGRAPSAVQLLVTRDFGSQVLHRAGGLRAGAGETMVGLLRRRFFVRAGPHDSVAGIDGLSAGADAGDAAQASESQGREWRYYVNGVQVVKAPSAARVYGGDHVWWDLHDASRTRSTPAVVGSFPEPFLNGIEGKRLPVRVECTSASGRECGSVTASLRRLGVPAAVAAIGSGGAPETLRVMVGPWAYLAGDLEAGAIAHGPRASGVYARFSADGRQLTLLDQQGRPASTLGADAGLVAATRNAREAPVWVVTGTDLAGVALAARAFNATTLAHRFAVALTPTAATALPVSAAVARSSP